MVDAGAVLEGTEEEGGALREEEMVGLMLVEEVADVGRAVPEVGRAEVETGGGTGGVWSGRARRRRRRRGIGRDHLTRQSARGLALADIPEAVMDAVPVSLDHSVLSAPRCAFQRLQYPQPPIPFTASHQPLERQTLLG